MVAHGGGQLLQPALRGCLGRSPEDCAAHPAAGKGDKALRQHIPAEQLSRCGEGGSPLQPLRPALADRVPPAQRTPDGMGGYARPRWVVPRLMHPRLELRGRHALSLWRPGSHHARRRVQLCPAPGQRPDELPRSPAAERGRQGKWSSRRRADGLHHEVLPRMAAIGRRCVPAPELGTCKEGPVLCLGRKRMGRQPGRRDGGFPAQHDGRELLRTEPADAVLVYGCPARCRGNGIDTQGQGLCQEMPHTLREGQCMERCESLQRRILRA